MKKSKKSWATIPRHKRRDKFNWKKYGWYNKIEREFAKHSSEGHKKRRQIESQSMYKIVFLGYDETEVYLPGRRIVDKDWYWN
jgi:hypothetical protein